MRTPCGLEVRSLQCRAMELMKDGELGYILILLARDWKSLVVHCPCFIRPNPSDADLERSAKFLR